MVKKVARLFFSDRGSPAPEMVPGAGSRRDVGPDEPGAKSPPPTAEWSSTTSTTDVTVFAAEPPLLSVVTQALPILARGTVSSRRACEVSNEGSSRETSSY